MSSDEEDSNVVDMEGINDDDGVADEEEEVVEEQEGDEGEAEEEDSHVFDDQSSVVATGTNQGTENDSHVDDRSMATSGLNEDADEDEDDDDRKESVADPDPAASTAGDDDAASAASGDVKPTPSVAASAVEAGPEAASGASENIPKKKKKRKLVVPPSARKGRAPAVKGLTIPFRTVKKAMKTDPDIPIVQNEAAIMVTMASELFLKSLAKESHRIAKTRTRNTIRYEDIAEARTKDPSLAFLSTLLP